MKKITLKSKFRILVVDDEMLIARNLQRTLIDLGHEVPDVACFGEEAIEKAERVKPDLIFMDIRLASGMDGIEAAKIIRSRWSIPVVFLTAYADEETLARAKDVAPYGYLVKPVAERDVRILTEMAMGRYEADKALKEAELALRKSNEELEARVQKRTEELAHYAQALEESNAELEQFAGVAAHDLRAPIKSMHSWIDMLDSLIPQGRDAEVDQAIFFIRNNAERAGHLIDDLLQVARVNTLGQKLEDVDLNKVCKDVIAVLTTEIEQSGAEFTITELPVVQGNPNYLDSLFSNLIRNAMKYRHKEQAPKIDIACKRIGEHYQFSIRDNGIGIAPEFHSRIFQMFKRIHADSEYPGTGIGLALCKKVVELSGGKIWVESQLGEGATFYFTYPVHFGR